MKKALQKYKSYAIVDDLLATGGTVNCVSNILNKIYTTFVNLILILWDSLEH